MSREPTSAMHREWSGYRPEPEPPPPPKPKGRPRKFKVLVPPSREQREQAMNKWMTTTEALTTEERAAVQRYRAKVEIEREDR